MLAHPECAARVAESIKALSKHGVDEEGLPSRVWRLPGEDLASVEELTRVHSKQFVQGLRKACEAAAPQDVLGSDTYFTFDTYNAAARTAGAACRLVDEVVARSKERVSPSPSGFLLSRPPGHHAVRAEPYGFCIFGTAAVAARHAQQAHGLERVMIYDFDVHHGNGTQDAFLRDPSVLFVSHHQEGIFPGTGAAAETGRGDGEGFTLNVPLPGLAGDAAARATFEEVVGPAARRFKPDLIVVSAGYDAHWRDPLANLQFRTSTFHWLVQQTRALAEELCGGRVMFVLEGGYDLKVLSESVVDSFRALLGMPSIDAFDASQLPEEADVRAVLREVRSIHQL